MQATDAQWVKAPFEEGFWSLDGEYEELPDAVQMWAGLNNPNPAIALSPALEQAFQNETPSLALLNDGGVTFAQIADLIEEQL